MEHGMQWGIGDARVDTVGGAMFYMGCCVGIVTMAYALVSETSHMKPDHLYL